MITEKFFSTHYSLKLLCTFFLISDYNKMGMDMGKGKSSKKNGKIYKVSVDQNTASAYQAPPIDATALPAQPALESLSPSVLQDLSALQEIETLKQALFQKDAMLLEQRVLLEKFEEWRAQAVHDREYISNFSSNTELQLQSIQEQLAVKGDTAINESQEGGANNTDMYTATAQIIEARNLVQLREEELAGLQKIIAQYSDDMAVLTERLTQAEAQNIDVRAKNQSLMSVKNDLISTLTENAATIENLTQTLANSSQQIEFSVGVSVENTALKQEIMRLQTLTTGTPSDLVPSYFIQRMQDNYTKAKQAISRLEEELSSNQEHTARDRAIQGIVACLKSGLSESNPEVLFTAKKEELNGYLNTLRGITSVFNTAVNAILTVLAVLSIVGIPGLLLTGTLQSNKAKHGSEFAFCMFGAKQKAERDIHAVMQSMSLGA